MADPRAIQQDALSEENFDRDMEHESNGPEGDRGVPLQRFSMPVLGLSLAVLLVSGALAAAEGKRKSAGLKQQ